MAYNPVVHQRLDELSQKYSDWYLSQARSAHDTGRLVLNADGIESSLSDCYEDAVVTAQALHEYLTANPPPDQASPRPEGVSRPSPYDVLDGAAGVSRPGRYDADRGSEPLSDPFFERFN